MVGDDFAGYLLRAVVGRGGMSVVYQAENPRLSSVVALKVLAPELATNDVFRARFLEESRIAASLNHPNVIPIYDIGSHDGLLYIAMRYVTGTDLRALLKKQEGPIPPADAVFLVGQAARALDAAHRKGLVHRDVKPGNLLIEQGVDGDPDHVYLSDFGITKYALSRSGLTKTGEFLGTLDYVSPEQIQESFVDGKADQYSLGCVLYECLTGRVPFPKERDVAIIWAHVEEMPQMPGVLQPELPAAIDDVFRRVMAKKPANRYASCREFVEEARASLGSAAAAPGSIAAPPGRSDTVSAIRPRHGPSLPSDVIGQQGAAGPPVAVGGPGRGERTPGPPEPRTRRRRRWPWVAALVALALIAAGAGGFLATRGSPGSKGHGMAMPPSNAAHVMPSALDKALTLANESALSKGDVPPSACSQQGSTMVTCSNPAPPISSAAFRIYPSLPALYSAYVAKIQSIMPGPFHANYGNCNETDANGEVSWNHSFFHPTIYSLAQSSSGMLNDETQAAGRMFCYLNGAGQEYIVWTQNAGRLLAWASGGPHADVLAWWTGLHHDIYLGGGMHM
jgi:serine/threonine-protein kinase